MDAKPPERPPLVSQLPPDVQRELDDIYKNAKNAPAVPEVLKVENYGPIKSMTLGPAWKDLGVWPRRNPKSDTGGNPYKHHDYRIIPDAGTLRIPHLPNSHSFENAAKVKALVDTMNGAVPKAKWSELNSVLGSAANSEFFTIESVDVVKLGGRRVITMTGTLKETGTREKDVYVSLSGTWTKTYEVGIGIGRNDNYHDAVSKFDHAMKTVEWRTELSSWD